MTASLLTVEGLRIGIAGRPIIDGVDLRLAEGEVTALVGRSGGGKSLTARALVGLRPRSAEVEGRALLRVGDGVQEDLLALPPRRLRALRGAWVGYVFQEAQAALNPTVTVGRHFAETLRAHGVPRSLRYARGLAALRDAGVEEPERMWGRHPFELSGGQAQRVTIALACAPEPRLLIADEVTSALDPVTQAGVLDTLCSGARAAGRALLLITHDLAVAGRWADHVVVLEGGRVVESGPARAVLAAPAHPFTADLVRASGAVARAGR
ncbi:ATP-binding cassette domain-containing protein [Marinactinospora thermotolerans]|uniref:Peptide/nickel transport system ATP-binding protein n=1 Tax=Marinactinospora thermotolerans DSM 45154 TaxID=1122192 RepID=A0A1T4N3T8_9ACTN|nr:ABC transporter ATP-binding protein [Marinactinospora thermotolerans]SJZ73913.1 peptide/nickel transport system ATP-binding protein [Marinactinospora thermotolerans DSM 45154]